jgi:hypothetical protein
LDNELAVLQSGIDVFVDDHVFVRWAMDTYPEENGNPHD